MGYHLTNVLLHGACAVLTCQVLRRLVVPGAWLAAALFAVHPVHVESVAWVIERKDVLSGALYLGALLSFLYFDDQRRLRFLLMALLLFFGALLGKSIVVTLPVTLALILWWRRGGRLRCGDLWPILLFVILAVALTVADLWIYHARGSMLPGLNFGQRILLAARAPWFYLGKIVWPYPLVAFYPQWKIRAADTTVWVCSFASLLAPVLLWMLRRRIGFGPLAGVVFFVITLLPALGLVEFGFMRLAWVADRFQYLASIGPLALIAASVTLLDRRRTPKFKASIIPLAAVLLLSLGCLTWRQAEFYRDSLVLFQHNISIDPASWAAHYYLGGTLLERNRNVEAAATFAHALELTQDPEHQAKTHHDLALTLARTNQPVKAQENFQEALRLDPADCKTHNNYGSFLNTRGRPMEALAELRQAIRLNPDFPEAFNNLGKTYLLLNRPQDALAQFEKALQLMPDSPDSRTNYATLLMALGRHNAGITQYRAVLRRTPGHWIARRNLAAALLQLGRGEEARIEFELALRQQPQSVMLRKGLVEAQRLCLEQKAKK